jgi:tetratricopeptide (TPR) repeat protein
MGTAAPDDSPESGLIKDLEPLVEKLARWQYAASGEGLASWEEISEADRRRFRQGARQTLSAIGAAGFRVSRPPGTEGDAAGSEEDGAPPPEAGLPECRKMAERFLRSGDPLLAYNVVQQGFETWPNDLRLRQLKSLALARSGAVQRAIDVLQALRAEGHADGETMGLLARTMKDLATSASDADTRAADLKVAFELYEEAYLRESRQGHTDEAYYTGINAATMALLRGSVARAREIAVHVRELCGRALERAENDEDAYWIHATQAEAALILREREEAEARYGDAAKTAGSRYGDLASTRRQARLILEHMGESDDWLERILAVPPVLIFTGHMIDRPGRTTPSFPPSAEPMVRDEIQKRLERIRPVAAYGSAACGADILCLEAMLDLGGEIHVTLPFPPEEFRRVSVDIVPDPSWGGRFERVLEAADSVALASEHRVEWSASSFEYANLILTGMGRLRSQLLETSVVGLAVWNGGRAGGAGGTGDVVELWRRRGVPLEHVDMASTRGSQARPVAPPPGGPNGPSPPGGIGPGRPPHEIKAMLFADAVGYSKFTENQITIFIDRFLGAVAALNDTTAHAPIYTQTVGDGLYFVFANTSDAGHYALELSELVRGNDWQSYGLPATFDIRIGLHCGPVFRCQDPVTKLRMYTGFHTSRTARIEPITPPGQVYASSAFAAVASATGVDDLDFGYIGRTRLAKKYGSLALYHVQRP